MGGTVAPGGSRRLDAAQSGLGIRVKVLHVSPSIAERDGGPSEVAINLCRGLVQEGVAVDLAYTVAAGEETEFRTTARAMVSDSFHVAEFARAGGGGYKYSSDFARWIRKRVDAYDVIHIHAVFSHTSVAAARAARKSDRPYILRPLGALSPFSLRKSPLRKRLFLSLGMRGLIGGAAAIHCTSREEESHVRGTFEVRRTFVLGNGVDDAIFRLPADGRDRAIIFLGRLDPKKNIPMLIHAFNRAALTGWRLIVAGDGEPAYRDTLHRLARSVDADIDFTGWLTGERKRALLASGAVFCLPSSDENFGVAAADAMAAAIPVIVTPQVSLARTVAETDAGWTTSADEEHLASVLREAASNADVRRAKGTNARRIAELHFRWRPIAHELTRMYGELTDHA